MCHHVLMLIFFFSFFFYCVVLLHSDTISLIPDSSFSPSTSILQVVVTQHVIQSQKEVHTTSITFLERCYIMAVPCHPL
jgi:hypothetical protein